MVASGGNADGHGRFMISHHSKPLDENAVSQKTKNRFSNNKCLTMQMTHSKCTANAGKNKLVQPSVLPACTTAFLGLA